MPSPDLQRLPPVAARFRTGSDAAVQMVGLTINVPTYAQLTVAVLDHDQAQQAMVGAQVTIDSISLADMATLRDSISAEITRLTPS